MKLKVQKSPFSLLNLRNLKIVETTVGFTIYGITFCSNTFSYKKLFNPTSYAKVITVLLWHNVFLQNISKFKFLIFCNN
jgi:hypothetical protein